MSKCARCKDAKHYLGRDGAWHRCECLASSLSELRYAEARVPDFYLTADTDPTAKSKWPVSRVPLPPVVGSRRLVWIKMPRLSAARIATVAHLMRSSIDAGLRTRMFKIPELVDSLFDRVEGSVVWPLVQTSDVLVVDIDHSVTSKTVAMALDRVVADRHAKRATTVFVGEENAHQMPLRYGHPLADLLCATQSLVIVGIKRVTRHG